MPALGGHSSFEAAQEVIAHLRAPEGCPWDREQTHESLRRFLIEEAWEVLEAIEEGDAAALAEELGDLLLQIVLHAQIATEEGRFRMGDVLQRIIRKMIHRHPHVWGDTDVQGDPEAVLRNWEELKRAEKAAIGKEEEFLLDGLPRGMPALLEALRIQERAAKVNFGLVAPGAGAGKAGARNWMNCWRRRRRRSVRVNWATCSSRWSIWRAG